MKQRPFSIPVPPVGPLLGLLLIGLLLLSALLYYRAVKIQRFLEPALAISRPRSDFAESIAGKVRKEFGTRPLPGIDVRSSSILVDKRLLFSANGAMTGHGRAMMRKLGRVFQAILGDEVTGPDISVVLVTMRVPVGAAAGKGDQVRRRAQDMSNSVLEGLFAAQPELAARYGTRFAAAVQSDENHGDEYLELRIVPSELLHVEVLQKLEKYAH